MELLFADAGKPALTAVGKGHGRLERRQVWVSGELAGYTDFPGLSSVVMVRQETEHLAEGRRTESAQYGVSSFAELKAEQALGLLRGHWRIENQHFHVKDDSFREDRQVLAPPGQWSGVEPFKQRSFGPAARGMPIMAQQ